MFEQYSMVRVTKLLRPVEEYDSWHVNKRFPRIGEIGTIVEILNAPGLPVLYVVEKTEDNGRTTWLSDFVAEELEPVTISPNA
jgi:hypothetical protein